MMNERVKIWIELDKDWHHQATESLWAIKKARPNQYMVKNVPFYAKGISYGDIIYAIKDENKLVFKQLISKSGHSTYRIILDSEIDGDIFSRYWQPLESIGCTYEKAKDKFYSIDVPASTNIYKTYSLLEIGERDNIWDFEEGDCGHNLNS